MASQSTLDLTGFKLTFDDEFNAFSSNGPSNPGDRSHSGTWDTTLSYSERKMNDELELYSDPTVGINPFSVANGCLDIHAAPSPNFSQTYGAPYTSGVITTNHSFSQLYGYFEMRAELPQGTGMWPAFWMLPQQHVWPPELDPLEAFGASGPEGDGGAYSFHNGQIAAGGGQGQWNDTNGANLYTQFNTFGVDWEPDTLTFYFNGAAYQTIATPAGFDQPIYLLANLAVGGHWAGAPIGESADMLIDYIRAYSKDGANPAVVQQAISSPDGRGYNFYGATNANGDAALGGVDLPPAPPTAPPAPTPAPTGDQLVGQGSHDLALGISEDDAQFIVTIDGAQVGGVLSTSASHSAGAVQTFHMMSDFSTGRHSVGLNFLNNFGGGPGGDRNLFLDSAWLDGSPIPSAQLNEYKGGEQAFSFAYGDLTAAQATIPGVTIGSGPDTLTLLVSEDAWQGDAQFTVTVDGVQIGGIQTTTISHGSGLDQAYQVQGAFGPGPHQVSLDFLNDAWGGSPGMDRNLYLDGASYAGSIASAASLTFLSNGAETVTVGSAPAPGASSQPLSPSAFAITDTTVKTSDGAAGETYSGPVASLRQQFIWSNPDGVAVASNVPDVFLHSGPSDDALTVIAGTNVLDGGGGSNFLVGAAGNDGGADTFFVDGRGGSTTWSTVVNFHHGDSLTVWGFVPGVSTMPWTASDGAERYKGATIHSELAGTGTGVNESATLAGLSIADVASMLTVTTRNTGGQDYLNIAYTG